MNKPTASALLPFFLLVSACSKTDGCTCAEQTVAAFPSTISSDEGVTVEISWSGGTATCEVVKTSAECDSDLDNEVESGLIEFDADVSGNDGGNSQIVNVLPQIKAVHVPGKQTNILVSIGDSNFEVSGPLTEDHGPTPDCGDCEFWAASLVER